MAKKNKTIHNSVTGVDIPVHPSTYDGSKIKGLWPVNKSKQPKTKPKGLLKKLQDQARRSRALKEALEDMVWQFASRGVTVAKKGRGRGKGKQILWPGGLSALEHAFRVLGWGDAKVIKSAEGITCDVEGCNSWIDNQGGAWSNTGYWLLCGEHYSRASHGEKQPQMKKWALEREASRDSQGRLPATGPGR